MKTYAVIFLLFLSQVAHSVESPAPAYKEAEAFYQRKAELAKSQKEKGEALLNLSILLWRDQELERALMTFLSALDAAPSSPRIVPSEEEKVLYRRALDAYLGHNTGSEMQETAQELLNSYQPILQQHPDYYLLNFMVAAAYANLGKYDEFFRSFYTSFQHYPDAYMSYRSRSILHIKLYERARTDAMREQERGQIAALLAKAVQLNGEDPSLYRMMIAFAPASEKSRVTRDALQTILRLNIMIPRQDILFYVQHAVDADEDVLAEKFIEKVRGRYPYSRVVNRAEEIVNKSKK